MGDIVFADKLRNLVDKYDQKQLNQITELICVIDSKIETAAGNGYDKFVIMFTCNGNMKDNDLKVMNELSIQSYTIRLNNDNIRNTISNKIKKSYEDRGCNVIYRNPPSYLDRDLIIEWV